MANAIFPSDEEQKQRFFEIVMTMRIYEQRNEKRNSFLYQQKIKKAKFLIDQALKGKRINAKFEVIPETTQQDFLPGL